jgi:hypothetical protein
MKTGNILVIAALMLFSCGVKASAGSVTIPNTFSSGTTAKASEVNANFSAVKAAVDDNDDRIADLDSRTSDIDDEVTMLESDLNEKLGVGGGTMTGNLTVPGVHYSTPRTHSASIPGDIFRPRSSSHEYSSALGMGVSFEHTLSEAP